MTRRLGAASGSWNLSSGEAQNRANVVHEFRSRPHIERAFLALKKMLFKFIAQGRREFA